MPNKKLVEDLRKQMRKVPYITLARELGSQIIDTLSKTIDQLKAAEARIAELDAEWKAQEERAENAEGELAALRGAAPPVVVLPEKVSVVRFKGHSLKGVVVKEHIPERIIQAMKDAGITVKSADVEGD